MVNDTRIKLKSRTAEMCTLYMLYYVILNNFMYIMTENISQRTVYI